MLPRSMVWRVLLALSIAVFVAGTLRYSGYRFDDTFISLRYARSLVEGQGLVFNPGERVEGYTNPSFVLFAAALMWVELDPLWGTLLLTGGSAAVALLLAPMLARQMLTSAERDDESARRAGALAACLLLTSEGFAYWAMVGMETMPFGALLTVALLLLVRENRLERGHLSALFFALLALTRPEGAFGAFVALGAAALLERRRSADFRALPRLLVTATLVAAAVGAHVSWRFWYYGDLLPNTFHAKVTGGQEQLLTGLSYFGKWALASPFPALALLAPLVLLSPVARQRLGRGSPLWLLWIVVVAFACNAVGVGGDAMPFFRFFVHVLPLACVVTVLAVDAALVALGPRAPRGATAAGLAVLTVAFHAVVSHATTQPYTAFVAHRTAVVGSSVGEWFREALPEGSLMAVNTIGTLPWASRLPTIDMLGLTDATIARRPVYISSTGWAGHRRGWGAYVLSRRPRAILWYNSAGSADPFYLGDRELAEDPEFRFFYRHRVQRLPALGESGSDSPPIVRFPGRPFGDAPSGTATDPGLGIQASYLDGPIRWTVFRESPITVHWFERDPRDAELWELYRIHEGDVGGFVGAVAETWTRAGNGRRPFDPEARERVEALCARALRQVELGELDRARFLLMQASDANATARSPLVYQYMANVAVLSDDLLVALQAQKEALRLDPGNRLYAENLERLLSRPWR